MVRLGYDARSFCDLKFEPARAWGAVTVILVAMFRTSAAIKSLLQA